MSFTEYLRSKILKPRLQSHRILVVFDPEERYAEVCNGMADEHCRVLSSVHKSLSSRLEATSIWQEMAKDTTHASTLLIYTNDPVPKSEREKVDHPFSAFVAMGAQFPDGPPDDYEQLCLGFLPDRRTDLAQLFSGENVPEFEHIDSLVKGANAHPILESIFGTGEVTLIIKRFLVPDERMSAKLEQSTDWCGEFRRLMERVFDFKLNAKITKAGTLRDKLWQFLLFSEFTADLPVALPANLAELQCASGAAAKIVMDLCEEIRRDSNFKEAYREAANQVEKDLELADECKAITDLGSRDTFSFEEIRFLKFAVQRIKGGDLNGAKQIHEVHCQSLWTEEGERQLLWQILKLTLDLFDAIETGKEELKHAGASGSELAELYSNKLSRVDQSQREMDTAVMQLADGLDEIEGIINKAHEAYRNFANLLQDKFLPAVQHEGWPFTGMPAGRTTFSDVIAPALKDGKRVVYFLMDALRLELAQKLAESLSRDFETSVAPVCAQLPCVTRFGMSSLVPGAEEGLKFEVVGKDLQPVLNGKSIGLRKDRLAVFDEHQGDRVRTHSIEEFIDATKTESRRNTLRTQLNEVDLVVVTSTELDSAGEGEPWVRQFFAEPVDKLMRAIRRSKDLGFDLAVVATDHGFLWIEDSDAGLRCDRPSSGKWDLAKRRCFIGTGDEPQGSIKIATTAVGIPCDAPSFVVPRTIGVYQRGTSYFHEGLSLQESLVGRMVVELANQKEESLFAPAVAEIVLTRKRSRVASLIVSVNLAWPKADVMFEEESKEFELKAMQGKDREVGFPSAGNQVNGATGRVRISPGDAFKVNIRLNSDEIEDGTFRVIVIDPKTEKPIAKLELEYIQNVF